MKMKNNLIWLILIILVPVFSLANPDQSNNLFQNMNEHFYQAQEDTSISSSESNLQIHGYLTQAYARTTDYQIFGITDSGTADYRSAALQFRYSITSNDIFVVQFAHERIGRSHVNDVKDDVELDWIFFEHKFTPDTSIKLGKIQIPLGFYNEIRDVGTLLPFYRPPSVFYIEGGYSTETLNGVALSHTFFSEKDWNIDTSVYYGNWVGIRMYGELYFKEPVNDMFGINVWLNTPYEGTRLGASFSRYNAPPLGAPPNTEPVDWKMASFSAEAAYHQFSFKTEYIYAAETDNKYNAYYGLVTYKPTEKLAINLQAEIGKIDLNPPFIGTLKINWNKDYALGIDYFFTTQLVAKFEGHWNKGFAYDNLPMEYILFGKPLKSKYFILSLSVSF
jgi:hypothetical protein